MTTAPCPICTRWDDDSDLRIAEFKHSYLILNRDQFFHGYCLLFTKVHVTELFHLERVVRAELIEEINRVAASLHGAFRPDKINYELLGNMLPHMHWHLVPRFATDPLWPRPIWAEPHPELAMTADEYCRRIELIQKGL
jgi:diadenosine tetraphosphate (Ap4A) HIT family hydrolase